MLVLKYKAESDIVIERVGEWNSQNFIARN